MQNSNYILSLFYQILLSLKRDKFALKIKDKLNKQKKQILCEKN